jgi:hypothetical protein
MNASKMLLEKLKEKGIPYAFWQAIIEVQEEAMEYAIMHHDINLQAKVNRLAEEERKIIGERVHGALTAEEADMILGQDEKEGMTVE